MDRQTLINQLYLAFEAAPRPKLGAIVSCGCSECTDIKQDFGPYQAKEVPASTIEFHSSAYPLLTIEAFRYFLPRIVEIALDSDNPKSGTVAEFLIYQLARKEIIESLSAHEREAISAYLEHRELEGRFGYEPELYEAQSHLGAA